ncbi:MAG: hypothetical protein AAGB26_03215 [Planctomycetota bacterium]
MKIKTLRRLRIGVLLGFVFFLTACMLLPDFIGQSKAGKYDPTVTSQRPSKSADVPIAETQTEPHTCGLHAMRSMYAAYGLDPAVFRLRFRLGTDQPATQLDSESTGTLHPDLYRVLAQDGFIAEPMDLEVDNAGRELLQHIERSQLALVLVYRNTYHWVLVGPSGTRNACVVYDSLKNEPVDTAIDALLDDALSITLVRPAETGVYISSSEAHAAGLAEMARLYQRKE